MSGIKSKGFIDPYPAMPVRACSPASRDSLRGAGRRVSGPLPCAAGGLGWGRAPVPPSFRVCTSPPYKHFIDPPSRHIRGLEVPAVPVDSFARRRYPVEESENETG